MISQQGGQRVSIYGKLFQLIVWVTGAVLGGLAIFGVITWLNFIYFFSYVKLTVTATKYLPQMIFNIRRKSTAGWSIYMIYLDIVGGSTSMMQMLTIAYNFSKNLSYFCFLIVELMPNTDHFRRLEDTAWKFTQTRLGNCVNVLRRYFSSPRVCLLPQLG